MRIFCCFFLAAFRAMKQNFAKPSGSSVVISTGKNKTNNNNRTHLAVHQNRKFLRTQLFTRNKAKTQRQHAKTQQRSHTGSRTASWIHAARGAFYFSLVSSRFSTGSNDRKTITTISRTREPHTAPPTQLLSLSCSSRTQRRKSSDRDAHGNR